MDLKKTTIFFFFLLFFVLGLLCQKQLRYYRMDTVKTIKGTISAIKNEKKHRKSSFIILYLKEKANGDSYRIEVSPNWFFNLDLMPGSKIEVTGSYCTMKNESSIMARSITFQGEIYKFRDKYGFPLWRGKRRYMQPRGQGKMKQR